MFTNGESYGGLADAHRPLEKHVATGAHDRQRYAQLAVATDDAAPLLDRADGCHQALLAAAESRSPTGDALAALSLNARASAPPGSMF
jgi:hypothetical protein